MDNQEYGGQVQIWLNEIIANRGMDAAKVLENSDKIEKYAEQTQNERLLGIANYYKAETYYILNNIELLFEYMTKALGYLERAGQWGLVARAYNMLAITFMNRGNAPFAMDYYLNGLACCKQMNLYEEGSIINMNIATLYISLGEYELSSYYLEASGQLLLQASRTENFYPYLTTIYISMAKCCMYRNMLPKAEEYMNKVKHECMDHLHNMDLLYVKSFEVRFYHMQGDYKKRDLLIQEIQEEVDQNFALLDLFDEFYEYCEMLFEIRKDDEFWKILTILEELAKKAKIINLQKKLLDLKIRYYKVTSDNAGYLQAAGLYYELSIVMERESNYMVATMLNLRQSLDKETSIRRKVERENEALVEKSETDALTQLNNRFRLNSYAEDAFARAVAQKSYFGVEILDIDYFKQYNDNYGHQAGDQCLKAIAQQIKMLEKRGNVSAFRYGGDEFVILYEGYSLNGVRNLMDELKQSILALKIEHAYSLVLPIVTISQGACVDIPNKEYKVWDFLHYADAKLYQGKEITRNSLMIGNCEECQQIKKWE